MRAHSLDDRREQTVRSCGPDADAHAGSLLNQGRKKPAELRAELDRFRDVFNLAYEQIVKSADDIVTLANVSQNQ